MLSPKPAGSRDPRRTRRGTSGAPIRHKPNHVTTFASGLSKNGSARVRTRATAESAGTTSSASMRREIAGRLSVENTHGTTRAHRVKPETRATLCRPNFSRMGRPSHARRPTPKRARKGTPMRQPRTAGPKKEPKLSRAREIPPAPERRILTRKPTRTART